MGVKPRAPHVMALPGRFRPTLFLETETDAGRFRGRAALLFTSREYHPPVKGRRVAATSPPPKAA